MDLSRIRLLQLDYLGSDEVADILRAKVSSVSMLACCLLGTLLSSGNGARTWAMRGTADGPEDLHASKWSLHILNDHVLGTQRQGLLLKLGEVSSSAYIGGTPQPGLSRPVYSTRDKGSVESSLLSPKTDDDKDRPRFSFSASNGWTVQAFAV